MRLCAFLEFELASAKSDEGRGVTSGDAKSTNLPAFFSSQPSAIKSLSATFPFLTTTLHGTVGYFSSGWPVAYLLATAILGVGS